MTDLRAAKVELTQEYTRAIVHMRDQIRLQRFGLVLGAGASSDFGFPGWGELISRIADDDDVQGAHFVREAMDKTSVSQLLFQAFRDRKIASLPEGYDEYDRLSSYLQSEWYKVVEKALYAGVPEDIEELKSKDRYMHAFLEIVRNTRLTINYNFDDTLQTLLLNSRTQSDRDQARGVRTVWSADVQLYPQNAVIYHPNGYLPRGFRDRPSDELIFLDDAFGDQLFESTSGHYAVLSYHFTQNTCLFIGVSLEDATLKHLLRRNARVHPGHVHYYVHFLDDDEEIDPEMKRAIRNANFEVYNLVTLFLHRKNLQALGHLLTAATRPRYEEEPDEFDEIADEIRKPTVYRFILTGSVSVGKTACATHFRSLRTHDEWFDRKASGMNVDPDNLTEEDTQHIDEWVIAQWRRKNLLLSRLRRGIHLVDRGPLDAFAFTPRGDWAKKAEMTRAGICPGESTTGLCSCKVIVLVGDPAVMAVRAMRAQKGVTPAQLAYRQDLLRQTYSKALAGIVEVDTREKSLPQVVKEISRTVHLDEYTICNLDARLEQILDGKFVPEQGSHSTTSSETEGRAGTG